MNPDFWLSRWREGRTGFHEGAPNRFLVAHAARLGGAPQRVYVPLCGKTRDLAYLAGLGHQVVGVELSPLAAEAFFAESGVAATRARRGRFESWSAAGIEILVGDYFDADREVLGAPSSAYDRAALIAMSPADRPRYAEKLLSVLPASAPTLLVTFAYDQSKMEGPPFSVPEPVVRALYEPTCAVEALEARDVGEENPRFAHAAPITESAFLVTKR